MLSDLLVDPIDERTNPLKSLSNTMSTTSDMNKAGHSN